MDFSYLLCPPTAPTYIPNRPTMIPKRLATPSTKISPSLRRSLRPLVNPVVRSASALTPPADGSGPNKKSSEQVLAELDQLLSQAKTAAAEAERSLEGLNQLPSANEEPELESVKFRNSVVRSLVAYMASLVIVSVFLYVSHLLPLPFHGLTSAACGIALGLRGYRKRSLDLSGAISAALVGAVTLFCSFRVTCVLLAFYFSSSALTKFKEELKDIEEGHKAGGQRNWVQVFANSLVPTVLAVVAAAVTGLKDVPLGPEAGALVTMCMGGALGYYACSCGDTWASELGVLSTEQPRLITTLRPVRRGSNGGVTLLGTAASILGGLFMGLVFCAASALSPAGGSLTMSTPQWTLVPMGLAAGIFGSLTDSILGATLQFTGFNPKTQKITSKSGEGIVRISGFALLDNNAVNFVSATLTALLFAFVARVVFVGM